MPKLRTLPPRLKQAPSRLPTQGQTDRQARRALNTGSKAWQVIRLQVLQRDGYRCRACGRLVAGSDAHVDHIGNDSSDNRLEALQTLCREGHSRKTWAEQHGQQWDGRCSARAAQDHGTGHGTHGGEAGRAV